MYPIATPLNKRKGWRSMLKRFLVMPMLLLAPATRASSGVKVPGCVERLNTMERIIYDAAIAKVRSGATPRNSVRAAVALVRAGQLPMRSVPAAAKKADRCLSPNNHK